MNFLNKLHYILKNIKNTNLTFLFILTLFTILLETFSIGALVPLVFLLLDNGAFYSNETVMKILEYFTFDNNQEIQKILVLLIFSIYFFKITYLVFFNWFQNFLISDLQFKLSEQLFKKYIHIDYKKSENIDISEIHQKIINETDNVQSILLSLITIIVEVIVVLAIFMFLLLIDFKLISFLFFISVILIYLFFKVFNNIQRQWSKERLHFAEKSTETIMSVFGALKEIKILSSEFFFQNQFSKTYKSYINSNKKNNILMSMPRLWIELIVIMLILGSLLYYQIVKGGAGSNIATLSIVFIGVIRFLPSFTKILSSFQIIRFHKISVEVIYKELINENVDFNLQNYLNEPLDIKQIDIKNLSFSYDSKNFIFNNLNCNFNKGDIVCLSGGSGSGKTTFIKLITGLYRPSKGSISFNNDLDMNENLEKWQACLGTVFQKTSLINDSIYNNIIFGRGNTPNQLEEKLLNAFNETVINEFTNFEDLKDYQIKSSGNNISGGQAQRIGLARAVLISPSILILDEATNALDSKTEDVILANIIKNSKNSIIFISSHNEKIKNICNKIIHFEKK